MLPYSVQQWQVPRNRDQIGAYTVMYEPKKQKPQDWSRGFHEVYMNSLHKWSVEQKSGHRFEDHWNQWRFGPWSYISFWNCNPLSGTVLLDANHYDLQNEVLIVPCNSYAVFPLHCNNCSSIIWHNIGHLEELSNYTTVRKNIKWRGQLHVHQTHSSIHTFVLFYNRDLERKGKMNNFCQLKNRLILW